MRNEEGGVRKEELGRRKEEFTRWMSLVVEAAT